MSRTVSLRNFESTLGHGTDRFGLTLRELCVSIPFWIPDPESESCDDEFCHQVRRALASKYKSGPSVINIL
jgi:hypothetical protein